MARVRTPSPAIVLRTTLAPTAVVPRPPNVAPSDLISVSAMKLSDGTFIEAIRREIVGEPTIASWTTAGGATPARAPRRTATPRRRSAAVNALAANRGGLVWKTGRRRPVKPRLKVSALSGPTSNVVRNPSEGGPRRPSNADSSPITRPRTSVRPVSAIRLSARRPAALASKLGSPPPRRYRLPATIPSSSGATSALAAVVSVPSAPKRSKRRRGRVELLHRGGDAGDVGVLAVQRLPGVEVEHVRAGERPGVGHLLAQDALRRRVAGRLRGGGGEQAGEHAENASDPGHRDPNPQAAGKSRPSW